jgi:ABC-type lipoprotein release transport system permease subunit
VHATNGTDVVALCGSSAVLIGAMLVAAGIPAVRASRVDPLELLKGH